MSNPEYKQPDLALLGESHISAYRESDGEVGYLWNGVPTLLLTTTGRRSGEARTTPLIFARDEDDYLVVASLGGAPQHPKWYLDLEADSRAEIHVQQARLIVDAARRLVAEKGENFTTQDLIKEAGVALQTVTQFIMSVFHQQSFAATRDPAIPEDLWRLLLGALGGERS